MNERAERRQKVREVGSGEVGLVHARAYQENPVVELVGVCDLDEERLRARSARLNVPGYHRVDQLLESSRPDLVSVVVRFDSLVPPVRQCLEAGVSVLSEKPISFSSREILGLIELADREGVQFGVNFNQRFTHGSGWFKRLNETGQFGEMLWTLAQYNQGGRGNYYALREHMIHQFDLWRYHLGEVASVTAQARWSDTGRTERRPEVVGATMQFVDGPIGVFTNGAPRVGGLNNYFELVGTEGRGYCENFVGRAAFRPNNGPASVQEPPWIGSGGMYWDTFAAHLDLVVAAIVEQRPMPVSAWDAFEAQCICDAVIEAIESGSCVDVQMVRQAVLGDASVKP